METRSAAQLRESLDLAENVFTALGRHRSKPEAGSSGRHQPNVVLTTELARIVAALRDRADGAGGFFLGEYCPAGPTPSFSLTPDSSLLGGASGTPEDCEVGREEFMAVMREAYGIVGRRVFDAALNAQLQAMADPGPHSDFIELSRLGETSCVLSKTVPRSNLLKVPPGGQAVPVKAGPSLRLSTTSEDESLLSDADSQPVKTPLSQRRAFSRQTPAPLLPDLCDGLDEEAWKVPNTTRARWLTSPMAPGAADPEGSPPLPWDLDLGRSASSCSNAARRVKSKQANLPQTPRVSRAPSECCDAPCEIILTEVGRDNMQRNLGSLLRLDSTAASTSAFPAPSLLPTPSAASTSTYPQSPSASFAGTNAMERLTSSQVAPELLHWQLPEETVIIFDWDDTLCPTTFIREDPRLNWNEEAPCFASAPTPPVHPLETTNAEGDGEAAALLAHLLHRHVEVVTAALRAASSCGHVVIVTLAREGWIELSSGNFLPGLQEVMWELGIEVIYARCYLPMWKVRSALLDELDVFQLMKESAMRGCLEKFYGARPNRGWKNVVSIGDSLIEHAALIEVVFCQLQADRRSPEQLCRCKTVKLLEGPDVKQLTDELQLLLDWIKPIALYDGDMNFDLSDSAGSIAMLEKVLQHNGSPELGGVEFVAVKPEQEPRGLLQPAL